MNSSPNLEALGIIAGNGRYPIQLAEAARKRGVKRIVIVGFSGETAAEVEKLADAYTKLRVGQLGGGRAGPPVSVQPPDAGTARPCDAPLWSAHRAQSSRPSPMN